MLCLYTNLQRFTTSIKAWAQQMKALDSKLDNVRSIFKIHTVKGEKLTLTDSPLIFHTRAHTQTHTNMPLVSVLTIYLTSLSNISTAASLDSLLCTRSSKCWYGPWWQRPAELPDCGKNGKKEQSLSPTARVTSLVDGTQLIWSRWGTVNRIFAQEMNTNCNSQKTRGSLSTLYPRVIFMRLCLKLSAAK